MLSEQRAPGTAELVLAARLGQPGAWDELVARYSGLVRSVVASYWLQEADAADAVQMTWLRAFERLDSIRDPSRLGGWLATTASRECLALLRRSRRESPLDAASESMAAGPGPEALALAEEVRGAVRDAIAGLPNGRRRLVHALFFLPEQDYASLAEELGMPVGSIGPTRGRVLRTLRGTLEGAGFGTTQRRRAEEPQAAARLPRCAGIHACAS